MSNANELITPRKLKGFRDCAPDSARTRKRIIDTIMETAYRAGFEPIYTPAIEYSEILVGTSHQETDKEMYQFKDQGGRDVALRFDLTVPFARFVAENQGTLVFPFKKIQVGDVWRGEKPQKGRYREFCQGDLDIVGADTMASDVEVISCLASILGQLLPCGFTVSIGHRILLSILIQAKLGQLTEEAETSALIALDKFAKIGHDNVLTLLEQIEGASAQGARELLEILSQKDASGNSDLELIKKHLPANETTTKVFERFIATRDILAYLLEGGQGNIRIDLSIARGLGYYTGVVFETTIDGLHGFGAICSGGRYNKLVSRFSRQEFPGVGGSVGVDRLLAALEELIPKCSEKKDGVYIAIATDDAYAYGFGIADELRRAGIITDIAVKGGKLANQFKYADKKNYEYVITVGAEEVNSHVFSLKKMSTGEETKNLPRSVLVATFKN